MTEILSAPYKSVFTTPKNTPPSLPPKDITQVLNDIDIIVDDMSNALKSISAWAAPGPDGVSAYFLKTFADTLAPALCHL